MSHAKKQIAILGAGIGGLSLAYFLKKNLQEAAEITVLEKASRVGGWIQTDQSDSFLFERGPRSIRLQEGQETLDLIEELGLKDQLLKAAPAAKDRYIYFNGALEKLPTSLGEFFSSPLMKGVPQAFFRDLVGKRSTSDESVFAFFERRFSSHVAETLIDPLMKGIYAGDAKKLSIKACFPKLAELEEKHRSVIVGGVLKALFSGKKGARGIVTLKEGMESLPKALHARLQSQVLLNQAVKKLSFERGGVKIHLDGEERFFDQVFSTLPAYALAPLLPCGRLKELLQQIPFSSVGVVHLGYSEPVNPYQGFGYLVPSNEKQPILGTVFDSSVFPEQKGRTRLSVMIEGDGKTPEEMITVAKKCARDHLGIKEKPEIAQSYIATQAIAQYPVGFLTLLKEIEGEVAKFLGFSVLGTSFYGVSVNQAIARSKADAQLFIAKT